MEALALLNRALDAGIEIQVDGEQLQVRGPKRHARMIRELFEHESELLAILRTKDGPTAPAFQSDPQESRTPPSPIGQARERCSRCSGSWYYPASDGWVCGMCLARNAATRATTSVSGLMELLVDFADALAVADAEGATTGRDWIEVFAPYQHARGMRPAPPREVWGALEELGYEVRGADTPQPLIIGLRLVLGEED